MGARLATLKDARRGRHISVSTNVRDLDELPLDHTMDTSASGTKGRPAASSDSDGSCSRQAEREPAYNSVDSQSSTRQQQQWLEAVMIPASDIPPADDVVFPWAPPTYSSLSIGGTAPTAPWSTIPPPPRSALSAVPAEPDDPLVAAARHNQTRSFHRLPDGVLLGIMGHLDIPSVECLRRVSRKFPPLTAEFVRLSRHFAYSVRGSISRSGPFPWPRFEGMEGAGSLKNGELVRRLDRDRYCAGCLQTREALDWLERVGGLRKRYKCSVCCVSHPACLFSLAQRRQDTPGRRCIAHEGYTRICSHKTVWWSDVLKILERERPADPPVFEGLPVVNALQCWDVSHRTECGGPGEGAYVERVSRFCREQDRTSSDHSWYPSLYITKDPNPITGASQALVMSWHIHIPLGRLGEWPPTASTLRRRFAELSENAGRFITLTTQPQSQGIPELRCFDPNDCDCVYFEGSEDLVDWRPYRPLQQVVGTHVNRDGACSKCHLDPARRLVQFPYRQRPSPSTRDRNLDRISSGQALRCRENPETCRVAERNHRTRVRYAARKSLHKAGEYAICARLCHGDEGCIRVEYLRTVAHPLPHDGDIPMSWYQSLDPDSYNLTSDAESYGIYWCREPGCRNYYQSSPRGFDTFLSGYRHLPGRDRMAPMKYHFK